MATELDDGIWWFDLRGVNAYLLVADGSSADETHRSDDVTVIDAGAPWTRRALCRQLTEAGFDPRDVDRIALTHYDLDHVGGLGALGFDCPIYAGQPDAAIVRGDRSPGWSDRKAAFQSLAHPLTTVPDHPVETITEGDTVGTLDVYTTPGHTRGHVTYVDASRSVAFIGDLVRESGGRLEASPWALSYDTSALADSIRRLAELDLDVDVLAMGHGTPFVEGASERLADLAARL
ncbi:MBL fold metallo-hydrolase [Halorhabdus sp. CBA1104]|uniref:MBL fold metallo-hydrolase n=1 Tax=Halorhabdus sp. CBA1104 TaxID=1380432 RepID=UPI0012B32485|nr:MBL fold metallo-hydrolase [Halorhabdus sp. CBA1104]QGN06782.1 MBL fold metallo-hydrolase [Halorhabdus sp. CBA1104]